MKKKYLAYVLSAAVLTSMMPTSVYAEVTQKSAAPLIYAAAQAETDANIKIEAGADSTEFIEKGITYSNDGQATNMTFKVTKEKEDATGKEVTVKLYNGSEDTRKTGTGTLTATAPGSSTTSDIKIDIDGLPAGNYTAKATIDGKESATGVDFTINKKEITKVTSVYITQKDYDGTNKIDSENIISLVARFEGLELKDKVNLWIDTSNDQTVATYDDETVGDSKPVTFSKVGLRGAFAANYTLKPTAVIGVVASIVPAKPTEISVAAKGKTANLVTNGDEVKAATLTVSAPGLLTDFKETIIGAHSETGATVGTLEWENGSGSKVNMATEKAEAGKEKTYYWTFKPGNNYRNTWETEDKGPKRPIKGQLVVKVKDANEMDSVAITGLVAPAKGGTPVKEGAVKFTSNTANVAETDATSVEWYEVDSASVENLTANDLKGKEFRNQSFGVQKGKQYVAKVVLTAPSGKTFVDGATNNITGLDGAIIKDVKIDNKKTLTFLVVYNAVAGDVKDEVNVNNVKEPDNTGKATFAAESASVNKSGTVILDAKVQEKNENVKETEIKLPQNVATAFKDKDAKLKIDTDIAIVDLPKEATAKIGEATGEVTISMKNVSETTQDTAKKIKAAYEVSVKDGVKNLLEKDQANGTIKITVPKPDGIAGNTVHAYYDADDINTNPLDETLSAKVVDKNVVVEIGHLSKIVLSTEELDVMKTAIGEVIVKDFTKAITVGTKASDVKVEVTAPATGITGTIEWKDDAAIGTAVDTFEANHNYTGTVTLTATGDTFADTVTVKGFDQDKTATASKDVKNKATFEVKVTVAEAPIVKVDLEGTANVDALTYDGTTTLKALESQIKGEVKTKDAAQTVVLGTWAWDMTDVATKTAVESGKALEASTTNYKAVFTPQDTTKYNTLSAVDVSVTVNAAKPTVKAIRTDVQTTTKATMTGKQVKELLKAYGVDGKELTGGTWVIMKGGTPVQDEETPFKDAQDSQELKVAYTPTDADKNYMKSDEASITFTFTETKPRQLSFAKNKVNVVYGDKVENVLIDNAKDETDTTKAPKVEYMVEGVGTENIATIDSATGDVTIKGAGKVTIKAIAAKGTSTTETDNYGAAEASYTLEIAKANATVTVKANPDKVKVGATTEPIYSYEVGTLVNGDIADKAITGTAKYEIEGFTSFADAVKAAGSYTVTVTGLNTDNYNLNITSATVTVEKTPAPPVKPNKKPSGGGGGGHVSNNTGKKSLVYVNNTGAGKNGTVEISNKNAKAGDKVTLTVKPDKGYELDKIVVKDRDGNKIEVKEEKNGKYTFTMPKSGKVDIEPVFTKVEEKKEETKREPIEMNTITSRTFNDVRANDWFKTAVDYVVSEGIMSGVGDRDFAPNQNMTRAMVWQVLAKIDGENTTGGANWYSKAMDWAMTHKITDGSNVNGKVTREQIASMLYRYAKEKGMNVSVRGDIAKFPDSEKVNGYASEAMQWAVGTGLINGMDGKLNPQGNATRAQVATMLMNFHQLMK